jgi:hypothetical protein
MLYQSFHFSSNLRAKPFIVRYPPDTPEKKQSLGGFFQKNGPPKTAAAIPDYVKAAKEKYSSLESWGIVGVSVANFYRHSTVARFHPPSIEIPWSLTFT